MSGMVSLALLMVFAFALGSLCKDLGTGIYVAEQAKPFLSPALVPALIFIISAFIAFSTGTSWGTFAIMIAIAVPLAQGLDTNVSLARRHRTLRLSPLWPPPMTTSTTSEHKFPTRFLGAGSRSCYI